VTAKKEKFITIQNAAGTRVAVALDKVEQVSFETVRSAPSKHLVLRLASSNVAIHHDEERRVVDALGIKDLTEEIEQGDTHE
jgi:hypothetical protein